MAELMLGARGKLMAAGHSVDSRHSQPTANRLVTDNEPFLLDCLAAMVEKDQRALARLYEATVSRVYAVALRITRRPEQAEEVVADTYLQAWRECDRYDAERGKVLAWLLIICRSRALDSLRRQDDAVPHPDPHTLDHRADREEQNGPSELLEMSRGKQTLHAALLELTPTQRQLVALAFFRGFSHAEIQQHTGVPLGSVKTHIRKALSILRARLGDNYDTRSTN